MKKLEAFIQKTCRILELVVAIFVLFGIILALGAFFNDCIILNGLLGNIDTFEQYLDKIFVIVIGIEFLQMLCRPSVIFPVKLEISFCNKN